MKLTDRIKQAEEQIQKGESVEWKPGMFTESLLPKTVKRVSAKPRGQSGKPSTLPYTPSRSTRSTNPK